MQSIVKAKTAVQWYGYVKAYISVDKVHNSHYVHSMFIFDDKFRIPVQGVMDVASSSIV